MAYIASNTNATSPSHERFRCASLQYGFLVASGSRFHLVIRGSSACTIGSSVCGSTAMPCVDPEEELTQAIEALRQKAGIPAGAGGDNKAKCRQVIAQKGLMLLVRAISHVLEAEEKGKAAT